VSHHAQGQPASSTVHSLQLGHHDWSIRAAKYGDGGMGYPAPALIARKSSSEQFSTGYTATPRRAFPGIRAEAA